MKRSNDRTTCVCVCVCRPGRQFKKTNRYKVGGRSLRKAEKEQFVGLASQWPDKLSWRLSIDDRLFDQETDLQMVDSTVAKKNVKNTHDWCLQIDCGRNFGNQVCVC